MCVAFILCKVSNKCGISCNIKDFLAKKHRFCSAACMIITFFAYLCIPIILFYNVRQYTS